MYKLTGKEGEPIILLRGGVGMEEMGMTDNQYKGMLLEDLENWEEVLELAKKENNQSIIKKAEKQKKKINNKLKF